MKEGVGEGATPAPSSSGEGSRIDFSSVMGSPRRVEIGGRTGTWFPADGKLRWDYQDVIVNPTTSEQTPGQLTLEPQAEQLELPHDGQ